MNKKETILWLFFGMVLGMAFIANLNSACDKYRHSHQILAVCFNDGF